MAPPQLEPPSSLMAVLRGGGGGVEGGCAGQSCAEHFTGPKQCACLAPTPLHQGRAILVCWFTFSLPCFALPVSSFWYFSCSFLSVDFFLWFHLRLLPPTPHPGPPPLSNFFSCLSFSPPLSYLHPHCNNLSDDTACVVFPDQSPGANS